MQPYLIEWLKSMVVNQKIANVVDPKLPEMPNSKELKRIILIALRCVDTDITHRPNMGEVIHMLEPCEMLLNNVRTKCFFQNSGHFFLSIFVLTIPLFSLFVY
jgi:hypothetical protein